MLTTVLDTPGVSAQTLIEQYAIGGATFLERIVPMDPWRTETQIGPLISRLRPREVETRLQPAAVANIEQKIAVRPIEAVLTELYKYFSLEDGWDGYEGKAPSSKAITDAEAFVQQLPADMPAPYTMPMPDGEIGLYWKNGTEYVEITFSGNGQATAYVRRGGRSALADIALQRARDIEQLSRLLS